MNIIKGIWTVINSRIFLVLLFVLALMYGLQQCSQNTELERQQKIKDQNISALTDSIDFHKKRSGELIITIDGYISSVKKLEDLNTNLWKDVRNQRGKVLSLNNLILQLNQDKRDLQKYIDNINTRFDSIMHLYDSTYVIPWQLAYTYDSTNFDIFNGQTIMSAVYDPLTIGEIRVQNLGSVMLHRQTQVDLTFGQKIVNDKLKIFVTSKYPGFTATSLQGVLIDPNDNPYIRELIKKRHWFTGFSIGVGISPGYDFLNMRPGLVVGPTFNFNIYEF